MLLLICVSGAARGGSAPLAALPPAAWEPPASRLGAVRGLEGSSQALRLGAAPPGPPTRFVTRPLRGGARRFELTLRAGRLVDPPPAPRASLLDDPLLSPRPSANRSLAVLGAAATTHDLDDLEATLEVIVATGGAWLHLAGVVVDASTAVRPIEGPLQAARAAAAVPEPGPGALLALGATLLAAGRRCSRRRDR